MNQVQTSIRTLIMTPEVLGDLGPIFANGERHEGLMYTISTPSGRQVSPPKGSHWRMLEQQFWKMVNEGRMFLGRKATIIQQ